MTWKIRHEGSPRSLEGLTQQQVLEGLRDALWEPTDEVMGPDDAQWVAIENHPQFAEVAADLEPPPRPAHEDETRLDMNPLIDVALVLLIFFILTTAYQSIRKVLDMPNVAAKTDKGEVRKVSPDQVKQLMVKVEVRQVAGKPVVKVEGQTIEPKELSATLRRFVRETRKTELLIDASDDVIYETVVQIQDAAKGAGIEKAYFLTQLPTAAKP
jgi:biopolymer transport protein ExbD